MIPALLPLLPFLGFLVLYLAARRLPPRAVSVLACAGPATATILALVAFASAASGDALVSSLGPWISVPGLRVDFSFTVDRLGGIMALVVTGVGTLIHIYAVGYMRGDPGYARFFAYMNLFLAAMLVLVLADDIVLLFLGWEGVGLCSYLLIGFWYEDPANSRAAQKAFVVNRIGDWGFLLGIFLIHATFGTTQFGRVNALVPTADPTALTAIGLLLFFGATGKSAQIPLHVWLPDAMAGPTPVSALIHAATMVTSGVYLLARLGPLFLAAPGVLPVVAVVGTATAVLGAATALTQTDIKKVLAYSTVSQLGYMFLAAGLGMFGVAIFHLVTHAFFKALLFLSAGAVIHSLHHEQDMRRMGGLRRELPFTAIVFTIGAATLAGFPLTAGFFSKDEILHGALSRGLESFPWFLLWALGYLTAAGTAFYAFRQVFLVFAGTRAAPHGVPHEGKEEPVHEAPRVMLIPLAVLAFLSVVGGFLAIPSFLEGSSHHGEGQVLGWILGAAAALGGIALARIVYVQRRGLASRIVGSSRFATLFARASRRRFWVDELYDRAVLRPLAALSLVLYYLVDRVLIDWILVAGTGAAAKGFGGLLRKVQTGRIPTYALVFLVGVLGALTLAIWAAR